MTTADEGVTYSELFDVIRDYAEGDHFHQVKALRLIASNYTPYNNLPMEETREVVDGIFKRNGYLVWAGGRPSLVGIDAIVAVAKWGGFIEWGVDLLMTVLNALVEERIERFARERDKQRIERAARELDHQPYDTREPNRNAQFTAYVLSLDVNSIMEGLNALRPQEQ